MTEHTTSLQNFPHFHALSLDEVNILDQHLNHQNSEAGEVVFHTDNLDAI